MLELTRNLETIYCQVIMSSFHSSQPWCVADRLSSCSHAHSTAVLFRPRGCPKDLQH